MTIATRTVEQGAALGRESVDRAQDILAEVADRLAEAASDTPRLVDSVSAAARDAAADLPDDLRGLMPRGSTPGGRVTISPLQGLVVVGAIVVVLAVAAAFIQRSRRKSAQRRRTASK